MRYIVRHLIVSDRLGGWSNSARRLSRWCRDWSLEPNIVLKIKTAFALIEKVRRAARLPQPFQPRLASQQHSTRRQCLLYSGPTFGFPPLLQQRPFKRWPQLLQNPSGVDIICDTPLRVSGYGFHGGVCITPIVKIPCRRVVSPLPVARQPPMGIDNSDDFLILIVRSRLRW